MRGTTRDPARVGAIEAAGVQAHVADPDRVASVAPALEHVTVVCVLLGSATGSAEQIAALHGPRLQMLLTKIVDSTVRGFVYESRGSVEAAILRSGAALVRAACEDSLIPFVLLSAEPADHRAWTIAAHDGVTHLLGCHGAS